MGSTGWHECHDRRQSETLRQALVGRWASKLRLSYHFDNLLEIIAVTGALDLYACFHEAMGACQLRDR